jgi:hypothetical protein
MAAIMGSIVQFYPRGKTGCIDQNPPQQQRRQRRSNTIAPDTDSHIAMLNERTSRLGIAMKSGHLSSLMWSKLRSATCRSLELPLKTMQDASANEKGSKRADGMKHTFQEAARRSPSAMQNMLYAKGRSPGWRMAGSSVMTVHYQDSCQSLRLPMQKSTQWLDADSQIRLPLRGQRWH